MSDIDIDQAFLGWIIKNKIRTEVGTPYEFDDHRFLIEPASDWYPKQVTMKSAQVGWSTMAILKTLYALKYRKYNCIYTLPTFDDVGVFVPSKVDTIISNNPGLVQLKGKSDAIGKKQIGENFIFYRGTHAEKAAIMLTSDLNIYDEYDASVKKVVDLYASRLQYSKYKGEWIFSNPLKPTDGVGEMYEASDQRRWMVQCSHCNRWQDLQWERNVDKERGKFICCACAKELDDGDRQSGEWVATYPSRTDMHGYHVSQLMVPWITAKDLVYLEKTKTKQYFYNMVLGVPYISKDDIVAVDAIKKCVVNVENNKLNNAMGVDVGLREKQYVLGNQYGIFKIGTVGTWQEIEEISKLYNAITVVDGHPDFYSRKLVYKYPGRYYVAFYKRDREKKRLVRWDAGQNSGYVIADRNQIIQSVIDDFNSEKIKFTTGDKFVKQYIDEELAIYLKHWENIYKIVEQDAFGIDHARWVVASGKPDHYVHATVYWKIAMEKVRKVELTPEQVGEQFVGINPEILAGKIPSQPFPIREDTEEAVDWLHS